MSAPRLRFIDLFAGIGGFHLALGNYADCVLASEIDAACQQVYRTNFPRTLIVGDIRELTADPRRIPEHDVLCGGFPCQPFSKSGFQQGLRDKTRGTLFFEIMEVVRARHPKFIVLENVRNIAGPKHVDTWRTIIESIREEGYTVAQEPTVFSPHLLPPGLGGAPQVRERVFILAARNDVSSTAHKRPLVENKPVARWSPLRWRIDDYLMAETEIHQPSRYALRPEETRWIEAWQEFIQHLDPDRLPGFPIWVDAFHSIEDRDPSTPAWKASFIRKNKELYAEHSAWIDKWYERRGLDQFPPSRRKFEWQARGSAPLLWNLVIHLRPSGIRVKAPTYLPALVAITQTSIIGARQRRITPREAARLQGFPDTFVLAEDDATAYRQLGNAVNVGVVRYVVQALIEASRISEAEQLELVS